jgi:hypothetical protein
LQKTQPHKRDPLEYAKNYGLPACWRSIRRTKECQW